MADYWKTLQDYAKTNDILALIQKTFGMAGSLMKRVATLEASPPGSASFSTISGSPSDCSALQSDLDAKADASDLTSHTGNTSNPHSVTKAQVSLGSVDNVQQMPLSYLDTDTSMAANSDTKVPSQKAVKAYVAANGGSGGAGILTDTIANRPTAGTSGRWFFSTNSPIYFYDNGSSWDGYYQGLKCGAPPAASSFTAVNADAATTFADMNGGLSLKMTGRASTEYLTAYVVSLPSAPYSLTVGLRFKVLYQAAYAYCGITLTDGTSNPKLATLVSIFRGTNLVDQYIQNGYYTNPTTWNTDNTKSYLYQTNLRWPVIFLRIRDDGESTRYYEISNGGSEWRIHSTKTRTDFFTPTHGGLVVGQNGAGLSSAITTSDVEIFHWHLGS